MPIRARPAPKKTGGQEAQALGRSRGGFSTKIHLRCNADGLAIGAVLSEGEAVIEEARLQFPHLHAHCVHRTGLLEIGDCAVWVGVSSPHRDEAFSACRYIIDHLKVRLPIWKKEYYEDGHSGWVNCEQCAKHGAAAL